MVALRNFLDRLETCTTDADDVADDFRATYLRETENYIKKPGCYSTWHTKKQRPPDKDFLRLQTVPDEHKNNNGCLCVLLRIHIVEFGLTILLIGPVDCINLVHSRELKPFHGPCSLSFAPSLWSNQHGNHRSCTSL